MSSLTRVHSSWFLGSQVIQWENNSPGSLKILRHVVPCTVICTICTRSKFLIWLHIPTPLFATPPRNMYDVPFQQTSNESCHSSGRLEPQGPDYSRFLIWVCQKLRPDSTASEPCKQEASLTLSCRIVTWIRSLMTLTKKKHLRNNIEIGYAGI